MRRSASAPKLVVGLGNPGRQYAQHRHNVGFQVVEALAEAHGLEFDKLKHKARMAVGRIVDQRVVLAKPLTYMNKSGESVSPLAHWYKTPLDQMLVVYDDLDIPLGTVRLRPRGGSGGHRGMRSIIQQLGAEDFPRLRVGIDRPPAGWDPADYVLSPFTEDEVPVVVDVRERAAAAIECWLQEGVDAAMTRFNQ
ncbi:MAG: Peptidyl-tRNA hydrolase [Anaerolineales bacterium]|nr:Peptidyl-tRNA hydrolase [Anaerolineales bacterium]